VLSNSEAAWTILHLPDRVNVWELRVQVFIWEAKVCISILLACSLLPGLIPRWRLLLSVFPRNQNIILVWTRWIHWFQFIFSLNSFQVLLELFCLNSLKVDWQHLFPKFVSYREPCQKPIKMEPIEVRALCHDYLTSMYDLDFVFCFSNFRLLKLDV